MARLVFWSGFVWFRVQEKVSLWTSIPVTAGLTLGIRRDFFSPATGQILHQGPAGRGQAEEVWGWWDVQPGRWGGDDEVRGFSSPFAVPSELFTY